MGSVSLSGSDVIQIDTRVLNDLADASSVMLEFENDLATAKTSKNGNSIYAFNNMGLQVKCTIRVLLGSSDDKWLNSRLQQMINDFSGFNLLTGNFSKRVGDGQGNISTDVYAMTGGIFERQPGAQTSSEGDTEQSVAVYTIKFTNAPKSIQ